MKRNDATLHVDPVTHNIVRAAYVPKCSAIDVVSKLPPLFDAPLVAPPPPQPKTPPVVGYTPPPLGEIIRNPEDRAQLARVLANVLDSARNVGAAAAQQLVDGDGKPLSDAARKLRRESIELAALRGKLERLLFT